MPTKECYVRLVLESYEGEPLPDDSHIMAALSHSTAGEALGTALEDTPCGVCMELLDREPLLAALERLLAFETMGSRRCLCHEPEYVDADEGDTHTCPYCEARQAIAEAK